MRLQAQPHFAGPMDLGVARQNLFNQCRPGARQTEDKYGNLRREPPTKDAGEQFRRERGDGRIDEARIVRRVKCLAAIAADDLVDCVGLGRMMGRFGILLPRVVDVCQARVQGTTVVVAKRRLSLDLLV